MGEEVEEEEENEGERGPGVLLKTHGKVMTSLYC